MSAAVNVDDNIQLLLTTASTLLSAHSRTCACCWNCQCHMQLQALEPFLHKHGLNAAT
jgi:hypothetical protein